MSSEQDPYLLPGTVALSNRLGLQDARALAQAERLLTHSRGREAARMTFSPDPDGYRALHRHLFQDVYEWAGQDRAVNIGENGALFTHSTYVANALSALFQDLERQQRLRGLSHEAFVDGLGRHLNELHAIHPFRAGNGLTLHHHAKQLARDAGHPLRMAAIDRQAWQEAARHGFITGDHRSVSAVLAAASAEERDPPPLPRTGPGGMAFLPPRDPPTGQRYRLPLTKVREELDRYLPAARSEAANRLQKLTQDRAPENRVAAARMELAYMRHAKGPVYQTNLLTHIGQREVDAVITAQQTPLERVREIGAALASRINAQQPAQILRAVRSLERPIFPPGHSPTQERLAALFLKNGAEQNKADPRLSGAQAVVERVEAASRTKVDGPRILEAAANAARADIAANIRAGKDFDDGIVFLSPGEAKSPAPGQGRSR